MRVLSCVTIAGLICGDCAVFKAAQADSTNSLARLAMANPANPSLQSLQAASIDPTNPTRSFNGRGVIQEVPAGGQTLVIRHEAIPGFMPKMTMEFTVRDTNEVRGLRAGDEVAFCVKANDEESWIEGLQRAAPSGFPPPRVRPIASLGQIAKLKPGDLLPDAELLAENGRPVKFSEFHGKALAFTFIFTRCPLPEFCPRMSHRFSNARDLLLHMPGGPTNWQFLSISFDPEFDTPGVLARYADNYRGQNPDRWVFAAAQASVLAPMTSQLDFRYADNEGSLVHNLRTVVLNPQGRIYRQFNGNQWTAGELAQALAEAAQLMKADSGTNR